MFLSFICTVVSSSTILSFELWFVNLLTVPLNGSLLYFMTPYRLSKGIFQQETSTSGKNEQELRRHSHTHAPHVHVDSDESPLCLLLSLAYTIIRCVSFRDVALIKWIFCSCDLRKRLLVEWSHSKCWKRTKFRTWESKTHCPRPTADLTKDVNKWHRSLLCPPWHCSLCLFCGSYQKCIHIQGLSGI